MTRRLGAVAVAVLLAGCASHPISEPLRAAAKDQPPFAALVADPAAYVGKTVVLSGIVLGAFPGPAGGTVLEVLQTPADSAGRPGDPDRSEGRFLAVDTRRLDPAIYAPGRRVAVGGEVVRTETREVPGGGTITYPVVEARELHLFPVERRGGPPVTFGIGIGIGF
ncbi:MAG TPA: Slp family lipoprotein [Thermodesulfobacteriota bacterium]